MTINNKQEQEIVKSLIQCGESPLPSTMLFSYTRDNGNKALAQIYITDLLKLANKAIFLTEKAIEANEQYDETNSDTNTE